MCPPEADVSETYVLNLCQQHLKVGAMVVIRMNGIPPRAPVELKCSLSPQKTPSVLQLELT